MTGTFTPLKLACRGAGIVRAGLRCGALAVGLLAAVHGIGLAMGGASGTIESAHAAKPENPGGGQGGGKPENPGGGGGKPAFPGRGQGDLYADLVVLYRDDAGRPILIQKELLAEEPGDPSPGTVFCLQPVAAGAVDGFVTVTNPVNGRTVSLVELGTGVPGEECEVNPDPLNAALVQEVLFGRLNMGRSPTKVLAQQLKEVTNTLAGSSEDVQIDEAGRFVWYDETGAGFEVDSPGNNLALYKELQVFGLPLTSQTNVVIPLPDVANSADPSGFLDHTAAALGAAAGKGDLINVDLIVYNNRILNIPNETLAAETLSTVAGGSVSACPADLPAGVSVDDQCQYGEIGQTGDEVYVAYGDEGYAYTRSDVFPGCVRGLLVDFPTPGTTTPFSGEVLDCVFGTIDDGGMCDDGADFYATGLHGFAQRADDARAVISFVHDNVVADSTAILPADLAGVDRAGETAVCDDLASQP